MSEYMYPIIINRERKKLSQEKVIWLCELSIAELKKHVSDEDTFFIDATDRTLNVSSKRFETDEEMITRIKREELYMENYNKFHNNILKNIEIPNILKKLEKEKEIFYELEQKTTDQTQSTLISQCMDAIEESQRWLEELQNLSKNIIK